jgi:hypothetical protein
MKKHYSKAGLAACDLGLWSYYGGTKKELKKRLTLAEILQVTDQPNVCKACIRIAVVDRLTNNSSNSFNMKGTTTGRMSSSIRSNMQDRSADFVIYDESVESTSPFLVDSIKKSRAKIHDIIKKSLSPENIPAAYGVHPNE